MLRLAYASEPAWDAESCSNAYQAACVQDVITGLVQMTQSNSALLVPVLEAISNITAQDAGQVVHPT